MQILSSLSCVIYGMVHKLTYYRKSYSDAEEFYNSNNGHTHKMRIKGRKEFIPYALFEAFKARDERLELMPHYSYYPEFLRGIAVAITVSFTIFFFHKIIFAGEFMYHEVDSLQKLLPRHNSHKLILIIPNTNKTLIHKLI